MTRFLINLCIALAVMGLGTWAYQEHYRTQAVMKDVRGLQARIGDAHERLAILRAEWAYLNRPDRLRDLADLNFDRLGLLPMEPDSFGSARYIVYPIPDILPITDPIDVQSYLATQGEDPL
ncbi:cell division protein FtsL [Salipiger sp. IMCC34102]|uniref:cell division protein FtsL n=1 Tax=Salipiger sp. IMCC34102 TaxID=2510647 RepID=UPI0013EC5780|nr:cell division protein FtsL [Salipiger sp. IMCC34102]